MTATVTFANVKTSAGATAAPMSALPKMWANLNGTGTIALRDSLNVSSVTDDGTGLYDYNLTNAISNANFGITGMGGNSASGGIRILDTFGSSTASVVAVEGSSQASITDIEYALAAVHGALA